MKQRKGQHPFAAKLARISQSLRGGCTLSQEDRELLAAGLDAEAAGKGFASALVRRGRPKNHSPRTIRSMDIRKLVQEGLQPADARSLYLKAYSEVFPDQHLDGQALLKDYHRDKKRLEDLSKLP